MKLYHINKNFFKVLSFHEHFIKCPEDEKLEKTPNMLDNSLSGWNKGSNQTYTERYIPLARGQNSTTVVFFIYLVR